MTRIFPELFQYNERLRPGKNCPPREWNHIHPDFFTCSETAAFAVTMMKWRRYYGYSLHGGPECMDVERYCVDEVLQMEDSSQEMEDSSQQMEWEPSVDEVLRMEDSSQQMEWEPSV